MSRNDAPGGTADAHGNEMSGDADTVVRYDRAVDRLVRFHPDVVELATGLVEDDSPAPMAQALIAYLHLMSTDPADLSTACEAHRALVAGGNGREQAHAAAIGAWIEGDWGGAAGTLDDLLLRWPTDLLALMFGHQLDFFLGDAQNLRDRPIRVLRELDPAHPHAPFVQGMAAFGLEESGHYDRALDAGLAAVGANPDDVWAIHAVVHTYEMQGRIDEGIGFLRSDATSWEAGNLFTVHNWWHLALYELEAGRPERSLAIYDAERLVVVDLCVVDGEGALGTPGLQLVQREVPPVVHGEQVPGLPRGGVGAQEVDAVVDASLHLVRVHDGVDGPDVVGVGLHRAEPGGEGLAVVPGLLEPERGHPADERGVGVLGIDRPQRADRAVAQ